MSTYSASTGVSPVPKYFDEECIEFNPAFRSMEDIRTYAELVGFWNITPVPVVVIPPVTLPRVYNPQEINRRNLRPPPPPPRIVERPLYRRPAGPVPFVAVATPLQRMIHGLEKKWASRPLKFFSKFYNFINYNFKKYVRLHKGEPITRRLIFIRAVQKVWARICPRHKKMVAYKPSSPLHAAEWRVVLDEIALRKSSKSLPDTDYSWEEMGVTPAPPQRPRSVSEELPAWVAENKLPKIKLRNTALLNKLRNKIRICRIARSGHFILFNTRLYWPDMLWSIISLSKSPFRTHLLQAYSYGLFLYKTKHHMPCHYTAVNENDDGAHDTVAQPTVTEDQAGNVCMIDQRECSEATVKTIMVPTSLSAGEQTHRFEDVLDRWIPFDSFDWSTSQAGGLLLRKHSLPSILLDKLPDSPNCIPFHSFMFFKPGFIDIKVAVNSSPFQIGQLQVAWLYDTLADSNVSMRESIYSLSQTMHALVNAGKSNPACLSIPYNSPFTFLPIVKRSDDDKCLHLGSLYIYVLNPLSNPDTVDSKCGVTIFIKFRNSELAGMRARNYGTYATPQMMSAAAAMVAVPAAERLLNRVLPDTNRDLPSYVGARAVMVPQACQSFAAGTQSVHPINHLRLDPSGTTAHFDQRSEMSVQEIASTFGLVGTHNWSKDHARESLLFSYDACPMFSKSEYKQIQQQSNICYYIPPVAVISSMYANWRGCLKMRLDVVKNANYSGRLMVCYVPRIMTQPTFDQVKCFNNMIFDVQEVDSITFTVPYVTNQFAWPRRQSLLDEIDDVDPPGRVWVFVLNQLIPMASVPSSVYINVYWAAGDSFEVGIPAQPTIGSIFWTTDDNPSKEVKAFGGYYPWYWGYYGAFYDGKKAIARYGPGYSHVAQFQNLSYNAWYTINAKYVNDVPELIKNDGTKFKPAYYVGLDIGDGYGMRYLGVVENEANARKYAQMKTKDFSLIMDVENSDAGAYCKGNPVFDIHLEQQKRITSSWDMLAESENDERTNETMVCDVLPCPLPGQGRIIWGESFQSLKDLCRRYQPYGFWAGSLTDTVGDANFIFPVVPQGMDLDLVSAEKAKFYLQKYTREGVIPLVSSGYRFFRGSVRFQLVISCDKQCSIWVQHKPDYGMSKWAVATVPSAPSVSRYLNSGYAMHVQTTNVNNVVSFEIPFYQPFASTYLQRTNLSNSHAVKASSLGTVAVGIEVKGTATVKVGIFYALGDDAQFHTFQGFPPMLLLEAVPPPSKLLMRRLHIATNEIGWPQLPALLRGKVELDVPALDRATESVNNLIETVSGAGSKIDDVACGMKDSVDNGMEGIFQILTAALKSFGNEAIQMGVDIVSQIGHILLHPTLTTICWAIGTILFKVCVLPIGLFGLFVQKLINLLKSMGAYVKGSDSVDDPEASEPLAPTVVPQTTVVNLYSSDKTNREGEEPTIVLAANQADDSDESIISLIGVGFMAVSQLCDLTIDPPKDLKGYAKVMTKGFSQNIRSGSFFQQFLKNNIKLFEKICNYFTCWKNQNVLFEKLIEEDLHPLVEWVEECEILLDTKNDELTFARDSRWAERLEYAFVIGGKLQKHFAAYSAHNPKTRQAYTLFASVYQRVIRKRDNMYKRGTGTIARREPFCIYLHGPAGCGKSTALQELIPDLLKHEQIRYEGEACFTLASGAAYWNGCRNQPAMMIDDFLNVESGEIRDTSLRDFWAVKSPAVLNPPQAHLDDKEARYAPEILAVASNKPFPKLVNVEMDAVYRRREMLVLCELKPEVAAKIRNMNDDVANVNSVLDQLGLCKAKYEHMQFSVAKCPSDPLTTYRPPMSWAEFLDEAREKFSAYRADQLEIYSRKIAAYNDNLQEMLSGDDHLSLLEKKETFKRLSHFLRYVTPKDGYSFKQYMKLAQLYSNESITMKDIEKMQELKVEVVAGRSVSSRPALSEAPYIAVRQFSFVEPLDGVYNPLSHKAYEKLASIVPNWPLAEDKIEDEMASAYVNKLFNFLFNKFYENAYKVNAPQFHGDYVTFPNVAIVFYYNLKNQIDAGCSQCAKHLRACRCCITLNSFERLDGAIHFIANCDKIKECIHFRFDSMMLYTPDEDTTKPGYFSDPEVKNPERIPDVVCGVDYCCWKTDLYETHMKAWAKNNELMVRTQDMIMCPSFWTAKFEFHRKLREELHSKGLELQEAEAKRKQLPPPISSRIWKSLADAGVFLKSKSKSWYDEYMIPALKKFWTFLKWAGPLIAVIGVVGSVAVLQFGMPWQKAVKHCSAEVCYNALDATNAYAIVSAGTLGYVHAKAPTANEVHASGDLKTVRHVPKNPKPTLTAFAKPVAQNQSGWNQNQQDFVRILTSNMYFMSYQSGGVPIPPMRILIVYENYAIMPYHFICAMRANKCETFKLKALTNRNFEITVNFKSLEISHTPGRDLALVRFKQLPNHKSLLRHMADADQHANPRGLCTMFEPSGCETVLAHLVDATYDKQDSVTVSGHYTETIVGLYSYNWHGAGRCGSILCDMNANKPIIGLHIAGNGVLGFGEPLGVELFAGVVADLAAHLGVKHHPERDSRLEGSYIPYGVTDDGLAKNQSGETQHVPSLVAGLFPIVTDTAPLRQGDPRVPVKNYSPLWAGCANMTKPVDPFPQELLDRAAEAYTDRLLSICKPVTNRVDMLTVGQAVVGIPGLKYFDGLDMHTSEGFPLSRYRPPGCTNKSWLFKTEGNPVEYKGMHEVLASMIAYKQNLRAQRIIPQTIFDDCLKDARLPLEKIPKPGKTRVFSTSSVDYTVAVKQSFTPFQASFKTHRLTLNHAIGINPDSHEWGILTRALLAKGKHFVTGDYSNFGPGLSAQVLVTVGDIIMKWFDKYATNKSIEHQNIRWCLLQETFFAYHLTHDYVWQAVSGLPSGCPLTVELNSMVNELYILVAWQEIHAEHAYNRLVDVFYQNTKLVTYGDDLLMSVSDKFINSFNNETLQKFFAKYKIKFTDASKQGNKPFETSLSECTFLKRSFVPHPVFPTEMLAPLNKAQSVCDTVNWVIKSPDMHGATIQAIEATNLAAYTLGPDEFLPIHNKLREALANLGSPVILRSWTDIDRLRFPDFYGCTKDPVL